MCEKNLPFSLSEYAYHVVSRQDGKKLISGGSLLKIIEENDKYTKFDLGNNTEKRWALWERHRRKEGKDVEQT